MALSLRSSCFSLQSGCTLLCELIHTELMGPDWFRSLRCEHTLGQTLQGKDCAALGHLEIGGLLPCTAQVPNLRVPLGL